MKSLKYMQCIKINAIIKFSVLSQRKGSVKLNVPGALESTRVTPKWWSDVLMVTRSEELRKGHTRPAFFWNTTRTFNVSWNPENSQVLKCLHRFLEMHFFQCKNQGAI